MEALMKKYHQLTEHQRYQLAALRKEGHAQNTIATNLDVHPSTISRELVVTRANAAIGRVKPSKKANTDVRRPPKRSSKRRR